LNKAKKELANQEARNTRLTKSMRLTKSN
jgi:hypothetical protein